MREFVVKGFFVCHANDEEFVLTQVELYQLLHNGAHFDFVRPLRREDFDNEHLFKLQEKNHA